MLNNHVDIEFGNSALKYPSCTTSEMKCFELNLGECEKSETQRFIARDHLKLCRKKNIVKEIGPIVYFLPRKWKKPNGCSSHVFRTTIFYERRDQIANSLPTYVMQHDRFREISKILRRRTDRIARTREPNESRAKERGTEVADTHTRARTYTHTRHPLPLLFLPSKDFPCRKYNSRQRRPESRVRSLPSSHPSLSPFPPCLISPCRGKALLTLASSLSHSLLSESFALLSRHGIFTSDVIATN